MKSAIKSLLAKYSDTQPSSKRQVNVRLDLEAFAELEALSGHYGVSRSSLAGDLLEVALREAMGQLEESLPSDEFLLIDASIRGTLEEAYHEEQ